MSVELEVKLGRERVSLRALRDRVDDALKKQFLGASDWPQWAKAPKKVGELGGEVRIIEFELAGGAAAQLQVYCAGNEDELGEEGGWWTVLSARTRSDETILLMIVIATCLASMLQKSVLDDALMLGLGRWISPGAMDALVTPTSKLTFAEAAERLRSRRVDPAGVP